MEEYSRAMIPKRFWGMNLDRVERHYLGEDPVATTEGWLEGFAETKGVGLLYLGDPGDGKTLLACCAGMKLIDQGVSVFYVTLGGYVRYGLRAMELRSAWEKLEDPEAYRDWLTLTNRLVKIRTQYDVVILDDVGKEHTTNSRWAEDEFEYLVRHRYDLGLASIMTSNVPTSSWATRYSTSMESFINEAFILVPVSSGKDQRVRARR